MCDRRLAIGDALCCSDRTTLKAAARRNAPRRKEGRCDARGGSDCDCDRGSGRARAKSERSGSAKRVEPQHARECRQREIERCERGQSGGENSQSTPAEAVWRPSDADSADSTATGRRLQRNDSGSDA